MMDATKNAGRFEGFATLYDQARPAMPLYPVEVITAYLGRMPDHVVDLGCGTGLSTLVWKGYCKSVTGIEPSGDMLAVAQTKQEEGVRFIKAFSHDTGLESASTDAVVCSQSFHWMDPVQTLAEVNRILKPGGVFAAVDCDWPPVCNWRAEMAYDELSCQVERVESGRGLENQFKKWNKNQHLANIQSSGHFRYTREIVFSNPESCTAERFIGLALSQGGLQGVLKAQPEVILPAIEK